MGKSTTIKSIGILNAAVIRSRQKLSQEFLRARPFPHLVIDSFLEPSFCRSLVEQFPAYDDARFRNEHGHRGKAHHENVRALGPSFRTLDDCIQSRDFLDFISVVTGIPKLIADPDYYGGGAHENLEDMELDPHVDFTLHPKTGLYRRINLLLYLNLQWELSWGGGLELHVNPWLPPKSNPIVTISPLFNRCVLFETSDHSWHGFETIRLPPGRQAMSRRSFALYLYSKEPGANAPVIPADLTVFVDRPLPERFRAGYALTAQDEALLQRLIIRRDWKLKYLYDRAIALFNQLRARAQKQGRGHS